MSEPRNLAELLLSRAATRPELRLTVGADTLSLGDAVVLARRVASRLERIGIAGQVIAVVDSNSLGYLVFWMACQLAGNRPALMSPTYPDDLVAEMLDVLRPAAIAGRARLVSQPGLPTIDFSAILRGTITVDGRALDDSGADVPEPRGSKAAPTDIAGYMHTSGTEGIPKFCAQSHHYFLALAEYVADRFCLSPGDRVLAPLPFFHINPFGYGFLGALSGSADFVGCERFSASDFWPLVVRSGTTVIVMHGPPSQILKLRGRADDWRPHLVRAMFFADAEFLSTFDIPLGVSAYGSTEAAGISHTRLWRRGEGVEAPEGMSRTGGVVRGDLEWRLTPDNEILVRERTPGVMFSGYMSRGVLDPSRDEGGWFHTGDIGRPLGDQLVFIERRADAIRVKGEYVPIDFVERRFAAVPTVADVALWKRPGDLGDDRLDLYVVADRLPLAELRRVADGLPPFMRPSAFLRIESIPRDSTLGKIQRRRLRAEASLEEVPF